MIAELNTDSSGLDLEQPFVNSWSDQQVIKPFQVVHGDVVTVLVRAIKRGGGIETWSGSADVAVTAFVATESGTRLTDFVTFAPYGDGWKGTLDYSAALIGTEIAGADSIKARLRIKFSGTGFDMTVSNAEQVIYRETIDPDEVTPVPTPSFLTTAASDARYETQAHAAATYEPKDMAYVTKTADFDVTAAMRQVDVDSADPVTATLTDTPTTRFVAYVEKTGAGDVTFAAGAGATLNPSGTLALTTPNQVARVCHKGAGVYTVTILP